jgi:hypothetical protein
MRFSVVNLILLGTALAVPIQEIDEALHSLKLEDTVTRRAVRPIAPKPKPVGGPGGPAEIGPPPRIGNPDAPGTAPNDGLPGLRPDDPNAPRFPDRPDVCTLKRSCVGGTCTLKRSCMPGPVPPATAPQTLPGSRSDLSIDTKYQRKTEHVAGNLDTEGSLYLDQAGLQNLPEGWTSVNVKNNQATLDKFDSDLVPRYEAQLKRDGWTDAEINKHIGEERLKLVTDRENWGKENIVETLVNPNKNAIIVKNMWNADFDLNRPSQGMGENGKPYTRPAIDESQQVKGYDMILDAHRAGLHSIGKTPGPQNGEMIVAMDKMEGDINMEIDELLGDLNTITLRKGDEGFDTIFNQPQSYPLAQGLERNPDYAAMEIKEFQITRTPQDGADPRDDMIIKIDEKTDSSSSEDSQSDQSMEDASPSDSDQSRNSDESMEPSSDEPLSE